MSMLSEPSESPLGSSGLSDAPPWQPADADTLAMLRAETDLVRRERYLGHWGEARATLDRLSRRLAKAAELAGTWLPEAVAELTVIRAVTLALRGRLEDHADALAENAVELFTELRRQGVALDPAQRTDWAIALAQLGRFDEALTIMPPQPDDPAAAADVVYELGRAYRKNGRIEDARRQLARAAVLDPEDPGIQTELGELELARGEHGSAAAAFRAAAAALARQARFSEALDQCRRSIEIEPENLDTHTFATDLLRSLSRHSDALAHLDSVLAQGHSSAAIMCERAVVLCELLRYQEALDAADAAIRASHATARLEFVRAVALAGLDAPAEALSAIDAALELEPENPLMHNFRARTLRTLEDVPGALAAIERTLALDPSAVTVYVLQATILRERGEYEAAIEATRRAVKLVPDDADANWELGRSLVVLERWREARDVLRVACKARPDDASVLALLAYTQVGLGQPDKAIKRYRKALALDPSLLWVRDELAGLLINARRPEEALSIVEETFLLEVDPSSGRHALRGGALFQMNRLEEALKELERAHEIDSHQLYANVMRGKVLYALGSAAEAIEVLTGAAQASPSQAWVIDALVEVLVHEDSDAALEAIARAQDSGLDRDSVANTLNTAVREAAGGLEALDRLLQARDQEWAVGLVVRAQAAGEAATVEQNTLLEALADIDRALVLEPEWEMAQAAKLPLLYALGRTEDALRIIDAALTRSSNDERFLRAKAAFLDREGDSDAGEDFLRSVIAQKGGHVWAYEKLAGLLSDQERYEDALSVFEHAVGTAGTESTVEAALEVLGKLGREDQAADLLRRAVHRNPGSVWLQGRLGEALWLQDRPEEALATLQRALELDRTDPYALGLKGFLLLERGEHIEPLILFDRALEREFDQVRSLVGKGVCLSEIGEFEKSLPFLDRALEGVSGNLWLRRTRAWARQNTGRVEEALADYEAANDADETDLWARKGAATCLSVMGERTSEAPPRFRAILEDLSRNEEMSDLNRHALEGWCRYRLGELDVAIDVFTEAIALDPLDASVQLDLALVIACCGRGRKARAEYERGMELARSRGPRAVSLLRVALADIRGAAGEREELASAGDLDIIQARLEDLIIQARADTAAQLQAALTRTPSDTPA